MAPQVSVLLLSSLAVVLGAVVATDPVVEVLQLSDGHLLEDDLLELDEGQTKMSTSDSAMALHVELQTLSKLTKKAQKMMAETEKKEEDVKKQASAKVVEAEISITNEAEMNALKSVEEAIDQNVQPCDDFARYTCGRWVNSTQIPSDKGSWSRSFNTINKQHMRTLQGIMNGSVTTEVSGPQMAKVLNYYSACTNRTSDGKLHARFLEMTKQILSAADIKEMTAVWGKFELLGFGLTPFSFGPGVDDKKPDSYVAFVGQGGFGLPDPEYYLEDNERFAKLREGYVALINELIQAINVPDFETNDKTGSEILAFEKKLAEKAWDKVKMRDPQATYNPSTVKEFVAKHLSFQRYIEEISKSYPALKQDSKLVVSTPPFLEGLEVILAQQPFKTVKAYTMWRLISSLAGALDDKLGDLKFKFYGTELSGIKQRPPQWKRCVEDTSEAVWQISDQVFVEHKFPGESKTKALEMVDSIKNTFVKRLDALDWMDSTTKGGANAKVNSLVTKIGFPDKWRSYSNMSIGEDYFENYLEVSKDMAHQSLKKYGSTVDKTQWHMRSSMVNAYYSPSANEIVFPAGILQPPFFSKDFPTVMNFGAVGSVIGHELSHAFDDSGSQYDATGKMHDWFSNASKAAFNNKTQCYVKQYSAYNVSEVNLAINGKLTLGENIADNAGVQVSLDAYKAWQKANNGPKAFLLNGQSVTDIQLFWIAYGQVWCSKYRPKALTMQLRNDPHSPGKFRTWGPAQNSQDFANAFKCPAGSKMAPKKKCTLW